MSSVTCDRSVVISGYYGFLHQKTDSHNITEILLKLALNSITLNKWLLILWVLFSFLRTASVEYNFDCTNIEDGYYNYSQTWVPRTRMGRIPWMAQTDLKVPSIFIIFLSKKKNLSLEHQYLEQSNSINGPINNKIKSFTMPNSNIAI